MSSETNKQFVRESLQRLEAASLRIRPDLDRELIVTRFIVSIADSYDGDEFANYISGEAREGTNAFDLLMLWSLAGETAAFDGFDDIGEILPRLSSLDDEQLSDLLEAHSFSIFENAMEICIVDEHAPGDYLPQHVGELESLACGDFVVQSVTELHLQDRLIGHVVLADGHSGDIEISDEKRPDLTPFFEAMNALVAHLGKGRFVVALSDNDEALIAVYLRPHEEPAFRGWAERQYCAGGLFPVVDWFE
ncbi:hypothetical protein [Methylosinus sp. LW3]|uniref:hypothetical protein n=1 Tax=Methylosinus sp. LW3 TaxID=107635 RepID=UPI0012FBE39B|nr:hypothetical protein [Methylosinus sp. LW3]